MKRISIFGFLVVAGFQAWANLVIKSQPEHGQVEFEAIGKPSMLKIKGFGEGAVADLNVAGQTVNGSIQFNTNSLKTGIDLRDEHMKTKYLHTKDYPQALLKLKDFKLPDAWSVKSPAVEEMPFVGLLSLHGVEKEVKGIFSIGSEKLNGQARFEIKLSDYNVDIPQYLGVKVADIVKVAVKFEQMTASENVPVLVAKKTSTEKKTNDKKSENKNRREKY